MPANKRELTSLSKEELIQIIIDMETELDRVKGIMSNVFERNLSLEDGIKKFAPFGNAKEYNQTWSWISKIVYAVKSIGRPVQSSDIAYFLEQADLSFKHYGESKLNNVSVQLTRAIKYKRLIAYKVAGLKAPYYCLPEWLNDNGELLDAFKFNPNFK